MATNFIEKDLLQLEKNYWQAIKDKDMDAALRLTDDPCLVAGAQGVDSIDKKTFKEIMNGASYTLNNFKIADDAKVRLLGEDVAILAYKVHEELTVDGKPVILDAAESSTWVRRNGKWLCAMHTESLQGDPYGRDRKTTH
jgi:hypothetical protein